MEVFFKLPRKTRQTLRMLPQMAKRFAKLRKVVPQVAAETALESLRTAIPVDREWKTYREGLEVARVTGLGRNEAAFAIRLSPRAAASQRVRKVDAGATVLYVRPRTRLARTSDAVRVLTRYNPWTQETLPFYPPAKQARVIAKRVTRQAAARVTRNRKRDRPFWSVELDRAGKREVRKDRKVKAARAKPVADVAHPALGLEFGIGRRARPHWRPAIRPFTRGAGRAILRAAPDLMSLLDPSFRGWKTWGSKVKQTISKAEAKKFIPFQSKLGF